MNYLKSVARISKEKIDLLFKVYSSDIDVVEKVIEKDSIFELCSSEYDLIDYSKKEYEFKYSFNGIATDKFSLSLSKSMIKQYLFLHFIPANKSGVRKRVSYSNLAKSLNISTMTVRNNFERLVKLGFIWVSKIERGLYDIVIVDEYKNHESVGKGYITMSLNMFYNLLSFENVNELKIELKKILWCDAKVNFTSANISLNKDNLLKVLPDYIRPSKRDELLNSAQTMFVFENGTLNYNAYKTKEDMLKPLYDDFKDVIEGFFRVSKMAYSKHYADNINNPTMTNHLILEKSIILDDLAGLAIQYNIYLVLKALQDMYINYGGVDKNETINTGGYIRSKIEEYVATEKTVI